jgi:hypothetical protein
MDSRAALTKQRRQIYGGSTSDAVSEAVSDAVSDAVGDAVST